MRLKRKFFDLCPEQYRAGMEMGMGMENFTEQNNVIWFVVLKVSCIFQKFLTQYFVFPSFLNTGRERKKKSK